MLNGLRWVQKCCAVAQRYSTTNRANHGSQAQIFCKGRRLAYPLYAQQAPLSTIRGCEGYLALTVMVFKDRDWYVVNHMLILENRLLAYQYGGIEHIFDI